MVHSKERLIEIQELHLIIDNGWWNAKIFFQQFEGNRWIANLTQFLYFP